MNLTIKKLHWGYFGLVVSMSAIYVATISPFNFILPPDLSWISIVERFRFGSNLKDYWQNILLFMPFGLSISTIVSSKIRFFGWILIVSLVASFLLSTTVELSQLFLPSRVSNFTDIIYNSLGGFFGGILYFWQKKILYFLGAIITGKIHRLSYRSLLVAIFAYCIAIILAVVVLSCNVDLSNWDENYYFSLGNEVTGNRPWDGYIKNLYISDRGLNEEEKIIALEDSNIFLNQDSALTTNLIFDKNLEVYQDKNKELPDLVWQNKSIVTIQPKSAQKNIPENVCSTPKELVTNAVHLNAQHWLKTKFPATTISRHLREENELAIAVTFATNNLDQGGPARIFSMAQNIYTQNIILGQRKSDLYFRLRTPITGRNATDPEFIISDVLNDCLFHNVLIEFKNERLVFYLDNLENKYSFVFRPHNNFSIFIPWNTRGRLVDLRNVAEDNSKLYFYTIVLIPLLFLFYLLLIKYNN